MRADRQRARRPGVHPGLVTTVQGAAFAAAREPRTSYTAAGRREQVLQCDSEAKERRSVHRA